jgi:hypothetical protein
MIKNCYNTLRRFATPLGTNQIATIAI